MPIIKKQRAIADSDIPSAIARDTETTAAITAHEAKVDPHPQYLSLRPVGIEFAESAGGYNYIDFHTHSAIKDFDIRLIASGGGVSDGLGNLLLQAGNFQINSLLNINGGAKISRLFSTVISIDLPILTAGAIGQINTNISGAIVGDMAVFIPLSMPPNLPAFNIQAIVPAAGVATIYFHNLSGSSVDVAAFSGRLLVLGFL